MKEYLPQLDAFTASHRVLLAGAGRERWMGGTRVDVNLAVQPDIVADLSCPLPFRDDAFDAAYGFSILEHLPDTLKALAELHRVVCPGGFVALLVPHFASRSAFTDPTHRRFFSMSTFDYVVPGSSVYEDYDFYTRFKFRYRSQLLMLETPWTRVPYLQAWANRHATFYEKHLCFLVRPAGIFVELEVGA